MPVARRATVQAPPTARAACSSAGRGAGTKNSISPLSSSMLPVKVGSMSPTTVYGPSGVRIVAPTASSEKSKRRPQASCVRIITRPPAPPYSSGVNVRPRTGRPPRRSKYPSVTPSPSTRRPPVSPRNTRRSRTAPSTRSKTWSARRSSMSASPTALRPSPSSPVTHTRARRSPSVNGKGRSRAAARRDAAAPTAAVPSAMQATAAAAVRGERTKRRRPLFTSSGMRIPGPGPE